ncbi:MAG TPA: CHAT domain-containing protein [Haliangium sp.]|nr:CHAT domain-containing protein [Haliangium sp.]
MKPVRILFLASNPAATTRRTLDEEARAINDKIRAAEHRDAFELITTWAVRPDDLMHAFNEHDPQVVHFSGQGNDRGEIVLTGNDGQPHPVSMQALAGLFGVLGQGVRVVVLNIGGSLPQATAIAEHVDCVVGMRRAISEQAVVYFAAAFYRALAFGRSVDNAFGQGQLSLLLENTDENEIPELVRGPGVDPASVVLVTNANDLTLAKGMPPPTPLRLGPLSLSLPESMPLSLSSSSMMALTPTPAEDDSDRPSSDTLPLWITTAPSREAALQDLLVNAFDGNPAGLLQWVRLTLGPQIHNELPSGGGLTELAHQTMLAAGRHGRVDEAMFYSLRRERPALAGAIGEVAQKYGIELWQH